MKRIFLILSLLFVLTGCSSEFNLNDKTNYQEFMDKLDNNNYTLSITVDEVYNDINKNRQYRYYEYHRKDSLYITFDDNIFADNEYHENEYIFVKDNNIYDIAYTNKVENDGIISVSDKETLKYAYINNEISVTKHITLADDTLESNFSNVIKEDKDGYISVIDDANMSIRFIDNVMYITITYNLDDGYKLVEFVFSDIDNTKFKIPKKVYNEVKNASEVNK